MKINVLRHQTLCFLKTRAQVGESCQHVLKCPQVSGEIGRHAKVGKSPPNYFLRFGTLLDTVSRQEANKVGPESRESKNGLDRTGQDRTGGYSGSRCPDI